MNLVDSSAWLAYFGGEPSAEYFADAIEKTDRLVVPSVCLYEVFRRILSQRDENDALQAIALMQQGNIVELSERIALNAAQISVTKKLAMADSIIFATAQASDAVLWTQDSDFQGLENVNYFPKDKER